MAPTFRRDQIIRLCRLMNMMYKPTELADEIGVSVDTVYRTYLTAGAPFERDDNNNIWINGIAFREWANQVIGAKKAAPKHPMAENEAWCLKCNKVVRIVSPKSKQVKRNLDMLQGKCPVCGTRVNRTVSRKPAAAAHLEEQRP